jgi:hypothetical protein
MLFFNSTGERLKRIITNLLCINNIGKNLKFEALKVLLKIEVRSEAKSKQAKKFLNI